MIQQINDSNIYIGYIWYRKKEKKRKEDVLHIFLYEHGLKKLNNKNYWKEEKLKVLKFDGGSTGGRTVTTISIIIN